MTVVVFVIDVVGTRFYYAWGDTFTTFSVFVLFHFTSVWDITNNKLPNMDQWEIYSCVSWKLGMNQRRKNTAEVTSQTNTNNRTTAYLCKSNKWSLIFLNLVILFCSQSTFCQLMTLCQCELVQIGNSPQEPCSGYGSL